MASQTPRQNEVDTAASKGELIPYIYRVVIEPDEERFYAEVPTLPGCYSCGYTYEEALKNMKEALELWLEAKQESGEAIPLDSAETIRSATLTIGVMA